MPKNITSMVLTFNLLILAFLGLRNAESCHLVFCLCIWGWYSNPQDSLLVMSCLKSGSHFRTTPKITGTFQPVVFGSPLTLLASASRIPLASANCSSQLRKLFSVSVPLNEHTSDDMSSYVFSFESHFYRWWFRVSYKIYSYSLFQWHGRQKRVTKKPFLTLRMVGDDWATECL